MALDIAGTARELIPGLSVSGIFSVITTLFIFVFFLIAMGILLWFIILRLKFNKKIVIFEKINGRFEVVFRDKGMLMAVGESGDQILYVKRKKKVLPYPTIQAGRNTYWYFIRKDGEWVNFAMEDLDEAAGKAGAYFVDHDMRYSRLSLQDKFKERFEKFKFLEKYAGVIINVVAIVIIMVFLWLIVDKMIDLMGSVNSAIKLANEVLELNKDTLVAIDNVRSTSGIR